MANPLKVLTHLSAAYGATVKGAEGIKVLNSQNLEKFRVTEGGAVTAADKLTISSNGAVVTGAVGLSSTLDVTDKVTANSGLDVKAAGLTVSGSAKVAGGLTVVDGGVTVTSGGLLVSADGAKVTGSVDLNNGLTVGGATQLNETLTVAEGKKTHLKGGLEVTGSTSDGSKNWGVIVKKDGLKVEDGVTDVQKLIVRGDFQVVGSTTTTIIESTVSKIQDPVLVIGSGSSLASAGDRGLLLEIDGNTRKGFFWDSSETMFKLADVSVNDVAGAANGEGIQNELTASTYSKLALGELSASSGITGSSLVIANDASVGNALTVTGKLTVNGSTDLGNDGNDNVTVSGKLKISGSSFTNIKGDSEASIIGQDGKYDVDQALRIVDAKLGGGLGQVELGYRALRATKQVALDGNGRAELYVAKSGTTPSATELKYVEGLAKVVGEGVTIQQATAAVLAEIATISFDVAVKNTVDSVDFWTNDLVSVKVEAVALDSDSYAAAKFTIDAPALTSGTIIRLIVVNENGDKFEIY